MFLPWELNEMGGKRDALSLLSYLLVSLLDNVSLEKILIYFKILYLIFLKFVYFLKIFALLIYHSSKKTPMFCTKARLYYLENVVQNNIFQASTQVVYF